MSLICMWMNSHFHMKRWAPRLALRKRFKEIRKWPIHQHRRRTSKSARINVAFSLNIVLFIARWLAINWKKVTLVELNETNRKMNLKYHNYILTISTVQINSLVFICVCFSANAAVYICYLPAGRSVLGKTVPEVLSRALGRTQDRGHSFSQYGPT